MLSQCWSSWFLFFSFTSAQFSDPLLPEPSNYQGKEAAHFREYFYIGGDYISDGAGGHVITHQMYVEELTPAGGVSKPDPIVFIHGEPFSGATWLNTPDGREGWASYFLKLGYKIYLVDTVGSARSSKLKSDGAHDAYSAEKVSQLFTLNRRSNYWTQSINHTQFPGSGVMGDPSFDAIYKSYLQIPDPVFLNVTGAAMAQAGAKLLRRIGPAILIGHGLENFALVIAEYTPSQVKAVIQVEPEGPPFEQWNPDGTNNEGFHIFGISETPLTFKPPVHTPTDLLTERVGDNSPDFRSCLLQKNPARQLVNLAKVPVLLVVGGASVIVPYAHCTFAFLKQAGVRVDFFQLDRLGIQGNGHFLHLELNNLQIAKLISGWLITGTDLTS